MMIYNARMRWMLASIGFIALFIWDVTRNDARGLDWVAESIRHLL